jgi:hypothetical protein
MQTQASTRSINKQLAPTPTTHEGRARAIRSVKRVQGEWATHGSPPDRAPGPAIPAIPAVHVCMGCRLGVAALLLRLVGGPAAPGRLVGAAVPTHGQVAAQWARSRLEGSWAVLPSGLPLPGSAPLPLGQLGGKLLPGGPALPGILLQLRSCAVCGSLLRCRLDLLPCLPCVGGLLLPLSHLLQSVDF